MNNLQIFNNPEFGEIRAIDVDGEGWFVGADVARALGYSKATDAVARHVDEDDSLITGVIDNLGRSQQTKVINESGVYALIILSDLPSAKKFKRWVTKEVLPSIRKHGTYITQSSMSQTEIIAAMAQSNVEMERRLNTVETLLLDVGSKAEETVNKLDCALKVFQTPNQDHWVDDMNIALVNLSNNDSRYQINLRARLYKELEQTAGHTNIDARLLRLRDRMKKSGMTRKECMQLTKLDAISKDPKLRAIFESIVRKYQAQCTA